MTTVDIQREQNDAMPREDLSAHAGQWVALREGRVVATDLDPVALRKNENVRSTDNLVLVPHGYPAVLIL